MRLAAHFASVAAPGPPKHLRLRTWPALLCAAWLAASPAAPALAQPTAPDPSVPGAYRNEWVEAGPDGRRTRLVRWAVGSRSTIRTLRVPVEYVEFAGGCAGFGPGQVDPNCRQPYSTTLPLLQAMLPDFSPVPRRKLSEEEERRVVHVMVDSLFRGMRDLTPRESLDGAALVALGDFRLNIQSKLGLRPDDPVPLAYKEPRFGLARLGLMHGRLASPRDAISLSDFLYLPPGPALADLRTCPEYEPLPERRRRDIGIRVCREWVEAQDFMQCMDEAIPTRDVDPRSPGVPHCKQWLAAPTLSASIRLRYERQHLSGWREWKEKTLALLASFMLEER